MGEGQCSNPLFTEKNKGEGDMFYYFTATPATFFEVFGNFMSFGKTFTFRIIFELFIISQYVVGYNGYWSLTSQID